MAEKKNLIAFPNQLEEIQNLPVLFIFCWYSEFIFLSECRLNFKVQARNFCNIENSVTMDSKSLHL